MEKAQVYLPISLLDVFEMIENDRVDEIYVENKDGLIPAKPYSFPLDYLKRRNFYVKQEYIPKSEQEDTTHGN